MTEKLYYKDAFIKEFDAVVLDCVAIKDKFGAVLDRTAFFPEGGGQKGDTGTLGGLPVLDTLTKNDIIYHIIPKPLEIGATVQGKLDWDTRFAKMQNHTGEHIVSGVLHSLYGIDNVGFALYDGYITFDTSKPVTEKMVRTAEKIANEAVFKCAKVKTYFPSEQQLANTDYRSKKDIDGEIRLVEIEGYDITACCAPQVENAGQIGIIKLVDFMNFRSGSRIWAVCGSFALDDYNTKQKNIDAISKMLCAKREDTADAVEQLIAKKEAQDREITELKLRLCQSAIDSVKGGTAAAVFGDFDNQQMRHIANEVFKRCSVVAVFSGNDNDSYSYILKTDEEALDCVSKEMNDVLQGRGGGRNGMAQGKVNAKRETIEAFFKKL